MVSDGASGGRLPRSGGQRHHDVQSSKPREIGVLAGPARGKPGAQLSAGLLVQQLVDHLVALPRSLAVRELQRQHGPDLLGLRFASSPSVRIPPSGPPSLHFFGRLPRAVGQVGPVLPAPAAEPLARTPVWPRRFHTLPRRLPTHRRRLAASYRRDYLHLRRVLLDLPPLQAQPYCRYASCTSGRTQIASTGLRSPSKSSHDPRATRRSPTSCRQGKSLPAIAPS